jgi:3-hydroxyacyl-CoA dehydrogenase
MPVPEIKKVAVIGSGVMGAGIAAHIANSHTEVLLLDIVPQNDTNRNTLSEAAVKRLLSTEPSPLTHKDNIKYLKVGNLEDDLQSLADVEWIIEAIVEKLEVKRELYKKLETVRSAGSIISSNTSTLPLSKLTEGMGEEFQKSFLISHFFNPPRYMRLFELIAGPHTDQKKKDRISDFVDIKLGKGIVECKDTPGFIANRIGCFWLEVALNEAIKLGISVEEADFVMSKPIGIPKTAVFGLFDLIGIDLMPLIAKSLIDSLLPEDQFKVIYNTHDLTSKMIADGYTGRKGKGGFYRINTVDGKRVKEVINLQTGEYAAPKEFEEPKIKNIKELVELNDIKGKYAWAVLSQTLSYVASLIPEISDNIYSVDEAMKLGYNWKYGPFELIDQLAEENKSGAEFLASKLEAEGKKAPYILTKVGNQSFYKNNQYFDHKTGLYQNISIRPGTASLRGASIYPNTIVHNESAALWDIGDGIVCFELTTKMNTFDRHAFEMLLKTIDLVKKNYNGLVIGSDSDYFAVGANLGIFLNAIGRGAWSEISEFIKLGQECFTKLKYATFPTVSALNGMALGGGCELLLHSTAIQAHVESTVGLVETNVGVIPAWGGCREMILRGLASNEDIGKIYQNVFTARTSSSAEDLPTMLIMNDKSKITMNRRRVISDSKALTLELSNNYTPPTPTEIPAIPVKLDIDTSKLSAHDKLIAKCLALVFFSKEQRTEEQVLAQEHDAFMELIKTDKTKERLAYMLNYGKPLKN